MALRQFLSSSIQWVPQAGFSVFYTENGGIEGSQDFLVRNADIRSGSLGEFSRGVTWETLNPNIPQLYRRLTLKTFDPTDRGDGYAIVKCTFTGYQYAGNGSSGEEDSVATTILDGQLEQLPLSDHPKWEALPAREKITLGQIISGEWVYIADPFSEAETFVVAKADGDTYSIRPDGDQLTSADAITFAEIITGGDTTFENGAWTYTYQTESETGFTSAQLNKLGEIVANPPGNPQKPGVGWTWLLANPNQTQSGPDRFMKQLNFKLIRDNVKNQFLYGS